MSGTPSPMFEVFVLTLRPRFCFNPGRWDDPSDLFVQAPDGLEWHYIGSPATEPEAFALMADTVSQSFADLASARWSTRQAGDLVDLASGLRAPSTELRP